MIAQKDITNPIWSVYLGSVKDQSDPDQGKSFYTFGSYDESVVKASGQSIGWTPVDSSQGFWMFSSASGTINGKNAQPSGNTAIADTGTTLIMMSDQFCEALYGAIDGAQNSTQYGGWIIPSTNVDKRPDVKVAVGDTMITIEKEQLGWSDLGDGSNMVFGAVQSRGESCWNTARQSVYGVLTFVGRKLRI